MQERNKLAAVCMLLLLIPFGVFFATLEAGFLNWDDDVNVFENTHVQGLTGENLAWMFSDFGHAIRYKPLSWLGWAVVHEFFGLNPFGYHLANVSVHCLNTLLLFIVLRRLVRVAIGEAEEANGRYLDAGCAMGALLWSLHPMRVEPIAWVTGFPYSTSLFLLLGSTNLYLRSQDDGFEPGIRRRDFWLSVVAYALSAITYPIVLGFSAVLVAIDFYPLRWFTAEDRLSLWGESAKRAWLAKVPFLVIAGSLVALTLYGRFRHTEYWIQPASMDDFGLLARAMQAAYVWAYYVWKPLFPTGLCPVYTTLIWNDPWDLDFVLSLVFVVGVSALLLMRWRQWPMLLAVWIAHLGILVPMLGLTERPHYAHDRYGIINGIFWSVMLVGGVVRVRRSIIVQKRVLAMTVVILLACGIATARYTRVWRDDISFFTHMTNNLGENEFRNLAQLNLGEAYYRQGRPELALWQFEQAEIKRELWVFPFDFQRRALGHGNTFLSLKFWNEAAGEYRKALAINPRNVAARNNLAVALWKNGQLDEAIRELREVVRLQPDRSDSYLNLGTVLLAANRQNEAIIALEQALRLGADPALIDAKLAAARR